MTEVLNDAAVGSVTHVAMRPNDGAEAPSADEHPDFEKVGAGALSSSILPCCLYRILMVLLHVCQLSVIHIFENTLLQALELLRLLQDPIQFREKAEASEAASHAAGRESDDDDVPFRASGGHGGRRLCRGAALPCLLSADGLWRHHAGGCV